MPQAPWEKYQTTGTGPKPWEKYGGSSSPAGTIEYKRETARQQFEANKPVPTAATGLQNLGESAVSSAKNIMSSLAHDVGATPWTKGGRLPTPSPMDRARGMYHGIVDPPVNYAKSIAARDPDAAARAGGEILTQTVPAVYGGAEAIKSGLKSARANPKIAESLRNAQSKLQIRALAPKSSDMRATATAIAPKLAERPGLAKLTGPAYDRAVVRLAASDAKAVAQAEELIPHDAELTDQGPVMRKQIDEAINKLRGVPANHPAIIKLLQVRKAIAALGDHPNARAAIELRRKFDKVVEDAGGFRQASSIADRNNLMAQRAGGNVLRRALNNASPELSDANSNFHVSRAGADIIEDRHGRTVGSAPTPSVPEAMLDLAGYTARGLPGVLAAEAGRLALKSRGLASLGSSAAGRTADFLSEHKPNPIERSAFLGPKAKDAPRDAAGQILWTPDPEQTGPLLPGTTTKNPKWTPSESSVADDTPRDIHGHILMTTEPIIQRPDGLLELDGKLYGERVRLADDTPRDPVTREILMRHPPPKTVGNDIVYNGKTHYQIRLTAAQFAKAKEMWMKGRPSSEGGQFNLIGEEGLPLESGATPGLKFRDMPKGQMNLLTTERGGGAMAPPDLFGIEQTPNRWNPAERQTYMTKDLQEMLREIESYLKSNPTTKQRQDLVQDSVQIRQEIARRQAAQRAGK